MHKMSHKIGRPETINNMIFFQEQAWKVSTQYKYQKGLARLSSELRIHFLKLQKLQEKFQKVDQ
jgi:hypothetical protein